MPLGATEVTKMSEGRQVGTVANEKTSVPAKAAVITQRRPFLPYR